MIPDYSLYKPDGTPWRILHFDCDRGTGHHSVSDLVQAGVVVSYPARSFLEAEQVFWALYRANNQIPDGTGTPFTPDLVVVDTITKLAETTRQDTVLDPSKKGLSTIWDLGEAAVASKREWGIAGDRIVRLLRNILELPIPSIFVAHQGDRDDPMSNTVKKVPDLQGMVLKNVIADTDAIVRLQASPVPVALPDGRVYPDGTRQLLLRATGDSAVGVRSPYPLPPFLLEPTLADFINVLHGTLPHNTLLFGAPKIGKTTLAVGANRRVEQPIAQPA